MINLEFTFLILLKKNFASKLFMFLKFSKFLYNLHNFFFQWIFILFDCHLAVVLLNSNLLEFLKYLYRLLSFAKNISFSRK